MKEADGRYPAPVRQLLLVVVAMFFSEAVVMMLLNLFQLDGNVAVFLDPLLLVLFTTPVLYFFVLRPMDELLEKNRRQQTGFKLTQGELEEKVEEQYRNLMQKNRAMSWEIAARRKSEVELQEKTAFLETVIESLDHPFYVIDATNYRIVLANCAAGFSANAEKSTCYELTHQRDFPCRAEEGEPCLLKAVVENGKPQSARHVHYDDKGSPHEVIVHTQPVFNADGKVTHVIEFVMTGEDKVDHIRSD